MKRNEALALIANQLDFINNKYSGFKLYNEFSKEEISNADVILTTLEHAGMRPPANENPVMTVNDFPVMTVNDFPVINIKNLWGWEDEDAKI